jgi:hypothetical protein
MPCLRGMERISRFGNITSFSEWAAATVNARDFHECAHEHVTFHAFLSHASEDKEEVASPLALELRRYGLKIWYDEFSMHIAH